MEPKKINDPDELGGWRINGRLGEGGFGTVFLAEKGVQKAAIKVIRQEFLKENDARNRLRIEAEVLSKLSESTIGQILDSDLSGEYPWIATEFVNGPTLNEKVKYEGPLNEIKWFHLAADLFHAIVSASNKGIIHKDIKPSNIILGETGTKLIDFGIAHISGNSKSIAFGDREGTTAFSSPEHFLPKSNPKMDVFSAAATLAFAAKGASIWKGQSDLQLMRAINEDIPNLDGLTENQVNFLLPLLEKNPSDRLSAQDALSNALKYIERHSRGENKSNIYYKSRKSKISHILKNNISLIFNFFKRHKLGTFLLILAISLLYIESDWRLSNYFWSILFLILPIFLFYIMRKTYIKGLGNSKWGKKSFVKMLLVGLLTLTLPIALMFVGVISSLYITSFVQEKTTNIIQSLSKVTSDNNQTPSNNFTKSAQAAISVSPSAAKTAKNQQVQDIKSSKAIKSAAPSSSPTPTNKISTSPKLSSDDFSISLPLASDVKTDSLFGRVFLDNTMFWNIPLTISKNSTVPPLTSIQFKLIGYPDAGWLGIPYQLKVDPIGGVYASVDDMLFKALLKNQSYCPEFRVIKEENGKIVQIWSKGLPACANDYNAP